MRKLNFFDILCIGIGGAIGSGIFVLMGIGISYTGRSVSLALILGSVVMLLAYMYNIFLVSMFPFKGGSYSQMALLFTPTLTGVNAIFLLIVGFSLSIYSTGIVSYAAAIFPGAENYSKLLSIIILTLFFAIAIRGSKFLAMVQNIMVVILVASILIFIIMGLAKTQGAFFGGRDFFTSGPTGFLSAVALMGFACQGATGGIALTADTKKPTRTIPLAILCTTIIVAILYFFMGVVAAGVLPLNQAIGRNLSAVAEEVFPHWIYVLFILGGAVFALATSLVAAIAALGHPISKIAEDGWLPKIFAAKTKSGYPWATQLTFYIISIIPIIAGVSFNSIVSLVMIPTMLIAAYCNLACIGIPAKYPEQWKRCLFHMPMPLFVILIILSAAADLFVAYYVFITLKPMEMAEIAAAFLACVALAMLRIKTKSVDVAKLLEIKKAVAAEASGGEFFEEGQSVFIEPIVSG
jgi:APA family basic amino acid/polyamine antiporter